MSNAQRGVNPRKLLLWAAVILFVALSGYGIWWLAQQHTINVASKTLDVGAGSTEDQAAAESTFNTFLAALRAHAYDQALQNTSVTFPSPHSSPVLMKLAETKFAPLTNGGDLQFEPVHLASRGQRLYLRAKLNSGGKQYHTVCTLIKESDAWRISDILPPVAPGKPPTASAGGAAAN